MGDRTHLVDSDELAQAVATYDDAICRYLGTLRRQIEQDPQPRKDDSQEVLELKEFLRRIYSMRTQRSMVRTALISQR